MSVRQLITFPIIPEEVYDRVRSTNSFKVRDLNSLKLALDKLISLALREDVFAQLILLDLYLSVNHESVHKDNSTGRKIELKLSRLMALTTGDDLIRENPRIEILLSPDEIALFDEEVITLVANNYREKGDLFFINSQTNSLYKLSIKSLVPSNDEINFGAFEFLSTFKGLPILDNPLNGLQERNRSINFTYYGRRYENLGLGSSAKLRNVWDFIENIGQKENYLHRFRILLGAVYKDDFMIYIKDPNFFKIYLVRNIDFIEIILDKIQQGFKHMRVEGNGLRVANVRSFTDRAFAKFEYPIDNVMPSKDALLDILRRNQAVKVSTFLSL
jgi:hypothetical protein